MSGTTQPQGSPARRAASAVDAMKAASTGAPRSRPQPTSSRTYFSATSLRTAPRRVLRAYVTIAASMPLARV